MRIPGLIRRASLLALLVLGCAAGAAQAAPLQWATTPLPLADDPLLDVTCPSPSRCLALDDKGRVLISDDPTGPASSWRVDADLAQLGAPYAAGAVTTLACSNVCVAGTAAGQWLWRNAAGTWRMRGGNGVPVVAAACDAVCLTVGGTGIISRLEDDVLTYAFGQPGPMTDAACTGTWFCVAIDSLGRATTWTAKPIEARPVTHEVSGAPLRALECPAVGVCVAGDTAGRLHATLDPIRGGTWRSVTVGSADVHDVACASPALCVALDAAGAIHTSADPSGATGWERTDSRGPLTAVSCSVSVCLAVDRNGDAWTGTGTGLPYNTAAPSIPRAAARGDMLRCEPGAWSGATDIAYQWESGGTPIAGATGPTHPAVTEGERLNCRVTATNGAGTSVARTGTTVVWTPLTFAGAATLAGRAEAGGTLRCAPSAITSLSPVTAVLYEWARDGRMFMGGKDELAFTREDIGHTYACRVVAYNAAGTADSWSRTVTVTDVAFTARIAPKTVKLATLLKRGLRVPVSCTHACTVTVKLTPDKTTARRLGLARGKAIGQARVRLERDTPGTARVKLTRAAQRAVKRTRARSLRVKVSAAEPGKRAVRGARTLTIRG